MLSAFLPVDHDSTYFGAQYRACTLDPSGFGLPLPGLPADFSSDLLARLWSGGTWAVSTLTHWVTLSSFMSLRPIPSTWIYLGTSTRLFGWERPRAASGYSLPLNLAPLLSL